MFLDGKTRSMTAPERRKMTWRGIRDGTSGALRVGGGNRRRNARSLKPQTHWRRPRYGSRDTLPPARSWGVRFWILYRVRVCLWTRRTKHLGVRILVDTVCLESVFDTSAFPRNFQALLFQVLDKLRTHVEKYVCIQLTDRYLPIPRSLSNDPIEWRTVRFIYIYALERDFLNFIR